MCRVVVDNRDKVIANVQFLVAAVRVCRVGGHQGGHMINHWEEGKRRRGKGRRGRGRGSGGGRGGGKEEE